MSVTNSIFESIDIAIKERTKKLFNTDVSGVIDGVDEKGIYSVLIDKERYDVPNGSGMSFKRGDMVWVHCPNGDFNKKFILGGRTGSSKTYVNESDGDYGEGSSITPQDIITNQEIDAMFS